MRNNCRVIIFSVVTWSHLLQLTSKLFPFPFVPLFIDHKNEMMYCGYNLNRC